MVTINTEITGDLKLGLRFEQFPEKLRAKLFERIESLTNDLWAEIIEKAPHKKDDLRRAIKKAVFDDPKKVSGLIGVVDRTQLRKAGALEYGGASRDFEVKGHFMRLGHVFENRLISPSLVFVEAHDRTLTMAAREFIRGPARAMESTIISELREVVGLQATESDT